MQRRFLAWLAVPAIAAGVWLGLGSTTSSGDDATREPLNEARGSHRFIEDVELDNLLRGNIHVHTRISDGDSGPEQVIRWYVDHDYDFVAITDHNRRVEHTVRGLPDDFVLVPGEEITMAGRGKPIHVNGLCTKETIGEARFSRRDDALRWAIDRIAEQGGVAMVNHPNFLWALERDHVASAGRSHLLDIYNGHPSVMSDGDDEHGSVETLWQELLDRGIMLAPAAVDDAHAFTAEPPAGVPNARPGSGWIEVAATERTPQAICDALKLGRLVASHGPRIERVSVKGSDMAIWVAGEADVVFIGRGGEELHAQAAEQDGEAYVARYQLRGDEPFVRARVVAADGTRAWTPAFPAMSF